MQRERHHRKSMMCPHYTHQKPNVNPIRHQMLPGWSTDDGGGHVGETARDMHTRFSGI
jgi:hypothetical protein